MSYRALARSAPVTFFLLGVLARLPYAMTPIGSLLLVQHATGSAAFAGLAAGAQSIAIAVSGFAAGGLAVRLGTRRLGTHLAVLNAVAAVLFVASAGSRPAMLACAVLVGLTQAHVGFLVRVHWSHTLGRGTALLRTAFSYESAVDEVSFVVGPAAAGLFAAVVPGAGPLLGMAILLLGAALPFATRYADGVPTRPVGTFPLRRMALLVLSMAALGAIFGAIQTAAIVEAGGGAGFLYACLGIGSAVSGVAYGWLPRSFQVEHRYVTFSATLLLGMGVLALSPWPVVGITVAGFCIAPYMITLYALADAIAPPGRLPIAMAVVNAGGPVGTAAGQSVAGALADGAGLAAAWLVPAGCAGFAVVVALLNRPRGGS